MASSQVFLPFPQLCCGIPAAASSLHSLGERERTLLHAYSGAGTVQSVFSQVILPVRACTHFTLESFWRSEEKKEASSQKALVAVGHQSLCSFFHGPVSASSRIGHAVMSVESILNAGRSAFLT